MIQNVLTINPEASPKGLVKRASDDEAFTQALELQTSAVLSATLDPSVTASLPGAGTALVEAGSARQDVSELAARRLTEQQSRQSTRERGLDAASQARRELADEASAQAPAPAEEGASATGDEADPVVRQPATRDRLDVDRREESGVAGDKSERTTGLAASKVPGNGTNSSTGVASASGEPSVSNAGAVAATRSVATAGGAGAPSRPASGVSGVQGASGLSARSESPGAMPGQAPSTAQARTERSPGRVYRQESRDFEAQLQRGLAQVLRQRGGTLSLKLDPADLGTVKVSLKLSQGRVEGTIEATSERARGLLNEHLGALKSSLEHRGITVDRLDVRLAGAGESERQFAAGQDAGRGQDQHGTGAGSDRNSSGGLDGGERHPGERGWTHGSSRGEELRGAEASHTDESLAQGRAGEPHGGWLRLDTLA